MKGWQGASVCAPSSLALLDRLGRGAEAADAYDRAADRTGNAAEQAYLRHARDAIRAGSKPD